MRNRTRSPDADAAPAKPANALRPSGSGIERADLTQPETPVAKTPGAVEQTAASVPASRAPTVAELANRAVKFYADTPNYTCRLVRQERLAGVLMPTEKILCHFRREPRSVYYKWLGDVCAGRECIWCERQNDGKIVSKGGRGDFGMNGRIISVAPDSFLAKSRSRYAVNESCQDQTVGRFASAVAEVAAGKLPADTFEYAGLQQPEGVERPLHLVREKIPPKAMQLFAGGGVREYWFDPDTGRLVILEGKDGRGNRQEYYFFEHLFANADLTDADFDPKTVWPEKPKSEK